VKTKLNDHMILMGADVDAVQPDGRYVDIKLANAVSIA
jgi:hypothetical protein